MGKAGRPKGSIGKNRIEADKAMAYIAERVSKELKPIIDVAIAQAKKGDIAARKDLFDRAYGKPKETVEHQGGISLRIDV
jgi:ribosomal protein L17